jgi:hypothetical protein
VQGIALRVKTNVTTGAPGLKMQQNYLDIVSESVSHKAFDKDNPFGSHSLSIESHQVSNLDIVTYARENRSAFLRLIASLHPRRKQMAIEYILMRNTEKQIATIHGRKSQSMLGQELKSVVREIAAKIVLGPNPAPQILQSILQEHRISEQHQAVLSSYVSRPSIRIVARKLRQRPSEVRTSLRSIRSHLLGSEDPKAIACAEYIGELLNRHTRPSRIGSRRVFRDPFWLGSFDVTLTARGALALFTSRAGQVSNAAQI